MTKTNNSGDWEQIPKCINTERFTCYYYHTFTWENLVQVRQNEETDIFIHLFTIFGAILGCF